MTTLAQPWPWWAAGTIVGFTVPTLLLLGNKHFGISANLRHICAACFPANIKFFHYDWQREAWNLFFIGGIVIGAILATIFLSDPNPVQVAPALAEELATYGITDYSNMVPSQLFSWDSLLTLRGFIFMVIGGFLVGFGTRYAGGCTSGHAIMGLSTLQWPSLVATICFMVGGFIMANLILPYLMTL
ncbi:MAG TPA: YeeE/YedE thiosulfate transporter family protein [Saprospiraceae bacterium]|nr:YeeE/YedE thiosulfate transporter family protein [Saprospiraceae bacterium]HND88660.1 YeeE/YedE thiosulfate transporter family protein [Saprospiraceae bacterium]